MSRSTRGRIARISPVTGGMQVRIKQRTVRYQKHKCCYTVCTRYLDVKESVVSYFFKVRHKALQKPNAYYEFLLNQMLLSDVNVDIANLIILFKF